MQGSAAVIGAGMDKIGQNFVRVGGAEQHPHRQAQQLGQVARQNVAEIARGNGEVHLVPQSDLPRVQQIPVCLEIVGHLRSQTADVDGVGRRKAVFQLPAPAGGEDVLHAGLGIVKIAPDGAYSHIAALLGHHLGALHLGHAAIGIEHADADAGHITEALQSGLARVAGGSGENQDFLFLSAYVTGGGEQLGQHGQRHVLKRGGRPPEQLQHRKIAHGNRGSQIVRFKFSRISPAHQLGQIGNIRQQSAENGRCHGKGIPLQAFFPVKGRNFLGHIQPAVRCQPLQHRAGAVDKGRVVSGRMVSHNFSSPGHGLFSLCAQILTEIPEILGFFGYLAF